MPRHFLRPALFTLFALASVPALATADTEHVSQTVRLDPGGTLRLNNFSGRVTVTGSDRPDVSIDAVRRGTRDQLDRVRLDIRSDASTLHIDANKRDRSWFDWGRDNVVETDFEIRVPRRTNLDLTLFSASLDVQGVDGSHTRPDLLVPREARRRERLDSREELQRGDPDSRHRLDGQPDDRCRDLQRSRGPARP